jgi:dTDP-4-dehydrorhamnose reductase
MEDTAAALFDLVSTSSTGLYLLNSNKRSTFYEIVNGMNKELNRWQVKKGSSPNRDDRMFDDRVTIQSIEEKLGL